MATAPEKSISELLALNKAEVEAQAKLYQIDISQKSKNDLIEEIMTKRMEYRYQAKISEKSKPAEQSLTAQAIEIRKMELEFQQRQEEKERISREAKEEKERESKERERYLEKPKKRKRENPKKERDYLEKPKKRKKENSEKERERRSWR